jgi:hypothetical protein
MPKTSMVDKKYSMGFTTCSLRLYESALLADRFVKLNDWDAVRNEVILNNSLQIRTVNSLKRLFQEISSRLKTLDQLELNLLIGGNDRDQKNIVWLSICRRYQFIADFAREVVRAKYLKLEPILCNEDFDIFFEQKIDWHEELTKVTPVTRKKARQVIFKMLYEASITTRDKQINPFAFDPKFSSHVFSKRDHDILYFPCSDI